METLWPALGLVALSVTACLPAPTCPDGTYPTAAGQCVRVVPPPPAYAAPDDPRRQVVAELTTRCSHGDYEGCAELGGIYLRGAIVVRDPGRGVRYLARACGHGHAPACDELATVYSSDIDLEDPAKARAARAQACELRGTCHGAPAPEPPTGPAGTEPVDVMIGSGTCFAISADGMIATAAHVVDGAERVAVRFGDEQPLPAKVVSSSAALDLAVLKVDRRTTDFLSVVADPPIALGDLVFTVGFPRPDALGWEPKFTDGTVSSLAVGGEASVMQISVPVHLGNSGGALVSEEGVLYGVVVAKLKALRNETTNNIAYAVKASALATVVEPPLVHPRGKDATRKEAIRRTTAATCLVRTRRTGAR